LEPFRWRWIDWSYGKATGCPPEGDGTFSPGIREQLRSFFATVREKVVVGRLPAMEDQLEELTQDGTSRFILRAPRENGSPERWCELQTIISGSSELNRANLLDPLSLSS
jgi:hypothetical protein